MGLSRRRATALIEEGRVRVNGRRARKGAPVPAGGRVEVFAQASLSPVPEPDLALEVVRADALFVVACKPALWPTHPLRPLERGTAANALVARFPDLVGVGEERAPGLVHRLDTGTSGLLLAARTAGAFANLRAQFTARTVVKEYLALVHGEVRGPLDLALPIGHDPKDPARMQAGDGVPRARAAETRVFPVRAGAGWSLVRCAIPTGVRHQIRVHLAAAGHPVAGDALYGGVAGELGLAPGRHALHAAALEFAHPGTGERVRCEAPVPEDFAAALKAAGVGP
jgi:23S rRNA pseudouridine1911/1915/1917 synthase